MLRVSPYGYLRLSVRFPQTSGDPGMWTEFGEELEEAYGRLGGMGFFHTYPFSLSLRERKGRDPVGQ